MMAIHPLQVATVNAALLPSAAFASHPGAGVLKIDGVMVDAPHLKQAQRILLRAADENPPRPP
jgi:citrate lyase subunit beta / citryl-CoA lyase